MEALKLISLFILIYSININTARADFLVAKAIVSILNEHFAEKFSTVTVISFGRSEKVLENVLRNKIDSVLVKVSKYSTHQRIELVQPTLLLFDSFDSFGEWNEHLVYQVNRRVRFPHLIYVEGATLADIKTLKWGFDGDSTNFLIREGKKSMALVTGFMFGPSWCGVNQFAVINRFKSSAMKWKGSTFYPDKYRNFHGCALNIGRDLDCEEQKTSYFFDILAGALNFSLKYFNYSHISEAGKDPKIDLFCDISSADETLGKREAKEVAGTRIGSDELIVIAPYGELLTPLEKMFMPFYFEVWVAIFVTLLMALLVIQIINRCTRAIQNAFYGGNNNIPTLSLAELFLCGAQRHVSRTSPARFILMMMVIWCLIIRTCYQSELFKCLQSDARKPGVKSVADIIAQNFTLYGYRTQNIYLTDFTKRHGMTSVPWKKHGMTDFDIVAQPENKAIAVYSVAGLTQKLNKEFRSGVPSFFLLTDEVLWTIYFEFYYRSGMPFKKEFDRKTVQMLEGGFTARWFANLTYNGKMEIKRKAEIIGPQVLTMDHLGIGFIVWLIPLALSVVVFTYEVGKPLCREFIKQVRDSIVARSVVLAFMNNQHHRISATIRGRPAKEAKLTQHNNLRPIKGLKPKHKIIIVKSAENQK